ncbi:hypothetical protein HK100_012422 [Physocladia obscura]|uniref:Uncharacterized protein n=1 Tax=Physocladia obscura TaxID=109957 RepID=A0AAD5T9V4_9FUNG|nr:hypothetical protein HK100_012422 [Physocladia obscura]
MITFRLTDPIVRILVDLIILSLKHPSQQTSGLSSVFIQAVYNIAKLRWLLYCVIENSSDICLPQMHMYSIERVFEVGSFVFSPGVSPGVITAQNQTEATQRILEYTGYFLANRRDQYIDRLNFQILSCFWHGVMEKTKTVSAIFSIHIWMVFFMLEKILKLHRVFPEPAKTKILAYLMTIMHLSPQLVPATTPKIIAALKSSISQIVSLEEKYQYSQFRIPNSQQQTSISPKSISTVFTKFFIDYLSSETGLLVSTPVLFDFVVLAETIYHDSFVNGNGADSAAWKRMREGSGMILSKIVSAQMPTISLINSFAPQIAFLCSLLVKRSEVVSQQILKNDYSGQPEIESNYLIYILEFCGLCLGKTVAVDIFMRIIQSCNWPVVAVPLDSIPVTDGHLGEWNSVYLCGSLRLAWKRQEELSDAYRIALETILTNLLHQQLSQNAPPNTTAASTTITITNLYYLATHPDSRLLHMVPESRTSYLLSTNWKIILALAVSTAPSAPSPASQATLLRLLASPGLMDAAAVSTVPDSAAILSSNLVAAFFSCVRFAIRKSREYRPMGGGGSNCEDEEARNARGKVHTLARICARVCAAPTGGDFRAADGNDVVDGGDRKQGAGVIFGVRAVEFFDLVVNACLEFGIDDGSDEIMAVGTIDSDTKEKNNVKDEAVPKTEKVGLLNVIRGENGSCVIGKIGNGATDLSEILIEKKPFLKRNGDVLSRIQKEKRTAAEREEWQGTVLSKLDSASD